MIATARLRIEATLQQPLGDMAIVQQRASGSDLAPPGRPQACRHPPDRGRHRLVVGALELLQHCSELTPSITGPQGQAAGNRRRPPTHTPGNGTARPRIEATLQRPLGDMAIVQQRASGSDLAPPGRPQTCRHPSDRGRHRLVEAPRAVAALLRAHPLDHRSPRPGRRQPPPFPRSTHQVIAAAPHQCHPAAGLSSLSALMIFRSTGTSPKYRFAPRKRAFRP